MKERPILFSGDMVRALLAGRKTQTRRVVKPQPECLRDVQALQFHVATGEPLAIGKGCPYGAPGDRLWVRETHLPTASGVYYRADFSEFEAAGHGAMYGGWKPSIHMPRWASRLTLEIVAVRVERLQDISEADARAEGLYSNPKYTHAVLYTWDGVQGNSNNPRYAYQLLWESIKGPGSWALNPWVWVIEFKRIGGAK